jgi:hypothetical protein
LITQLKKIRNFSKYFSTGDRFGRDFRPNRMIHHASPPDDEDVLMLILSLCPNFFSDRTGRTSKEGSGHLAFRFISPMLFIIMPVNPGRGLNLTKPILYHPAYRRSFPDHPAKKKNG